MTEKWIFTTSVHRAPLAILSIATSTHASSIENDLERSPLSRPQRWCRRAAESLYGTPTEELTITAKYSSRAEASHIVMLLMLKWWPLFNRPENGWVPLSNSCGGSYRDKLLVSDVPFLSSERCSWTEDRAMAWSQPRVSRIPEKHWKIRVYRVSAEVSY